MKLNTHGYFRVDGEHSAISYQWSTVSRFDAFAEDEVQREACETCVESKENKKADS
jgi:hypothetical protein